MTGNDNGTAQREQFVEPRHRPLQRRRNRSGDLDEDERDLINRVMRRFERRVDSFDARNNWILERTRRMNIDIGPRTWNVHYTPAVRINSSVVSSDPATDEDPPQSERAFANFESSLEDPATEGLGPSEQQSTSNGSAEERAVWPPLRDWFGYDEDSLDRPTGEAAARQQSPASADVEESSSKGVAALPGGKRAARKRTEQLDSFEQETGGKPASSKSVMDQEEDPVSFEDWLASNPTQHMTRRERRRNCPMRKPDNEPEEYFALNKLPFRAAPRDAAIPRCELDPDREHRVMIEEVRGPTDYTVRLVDLVQTYYDFQADVAWRYSAQLRTEYALSNSGPLKVGRACVVMYSVTYIHPHRAVVESFDLLRRTAEVTLVDKAAREEVPIENLVQLDESMLEHPISAFRVIDPSCDIAYAPETKLSMRVKRVMSDVMEVELIPDSDRMNRKKVVQRKMPTTQMEGTATRHHGVPAATTREPSARARPKSPVLPSNDLRRLRLDSMEREQRTTARPSQIFERGNNLALRSNDRMPLEFHPGHNTEGRRLARRVNPVELEPILENEDFRFGFAAFMGQQNNNPHRESAEIGIERQHSGNAGNRPRPHEAASVQQWDPADGRQRSLVDGRRLDREDGSFPAPLGGFARDLSPRENRRRVGSGYDYQAGPARYERHQNADAHYQREEYDRQDGARHSKGPSGFYDKRRGPRFADVGHNTDVGGSIQVQMYHDGTRDGHRRRNDFPSQDFRGNSPLLPARGPQTMYNPPHYPNEDARSFFYTAILDPPNDNRPRGSGARPPRRA